MRKVLQPLQTTKYKYKRWFAFELFRPLTVTVLRTGPLYMAHGRYE